MEEKNEETHRYAGAEIRVIAMDSKMLPFVYKVQLRPDLNAFVFGHLTSASEPFDGTGGGLKWQFIIYML